MTKAEIEKTLHEMIHESLLDDDGVWPTPDPHALGQQLEDWDLVHEEDGTGNIQTTDLGRELRINLLGLFLGYHEPFEIPSCLQHEGVLDWEQANELEAQCLDKNGDAREVDDLAPILKPVLARLYRQEFPEHIADDADDADDAQAVAELG